MQRRGGVRNLCVWIGWATASLAAGGIASASRDEDLFIRPEDQHTVLFGSLDAGRSVFVSGGAKQALTGSLDRDGWVIMESSGYGLTREKKQADTGPIQIDRLKHQASVVVGRQWIVGPVYVAAYAGPEVQQEQLTYDGRIRRFSDPRLGVRGQIELWANPTPETLLTGTVVTTTTRGSVWARGSAGLKIWTDTYVGPEVTVYATPTYTERKFGGHLTGPSFGPATMRISAGWMTDDAHRRGSPYLGLTAWIRL